MRRQRVVLLVFEDCSDGMYDEACVKLRAHLQKSYNTREVELRHRGDGSASVRVHSYTPSA